MPSPGEIPLTPTDELTLCVRGKYYVLGIYAGSADGYWLLVVQSGHEEMVEYKEPSGRRELVVAYGPHPCGYGVFVRGRGATWTTSPGAAVEMIVLMTMRKWDKLAR